MRELSPLQKVAIANLAQQIEVLAKAVDKLARADAEYRQLAALDYAPRRNGHLQLQHKEDAE